MIIWPKNTEKPDGNKKKEDVAQPSAGGHNQGLPARSSLKLSHRLNFRALRTHQPVFRVLRTPSGEGIWVPTNTLLTSFLDETLYLRTII